MQPDPQSLAPERKVVPTAGLLCALFAVAALIPFVLTTVPSMNDLPGHLARYEILSSISSSPDLQRFYAFNWKLLGNLGGDLLAWAMAPALGAERAGLLVAAAIAPLTIAGIAAVSRALHGRIEPSAAVAACFVFNNPFLFGFVNYSLSIAVALFTFAAWVRLREERLAWHFAILSPLILLTWLCHLAGLGALGLLVIGFEAHRFGVGFPAASARGVALRFIVFVPPVALTLLWMERSEAVTSYGTGLIGQKIMAFVAVLRGVDPFIDIGAAVAIFLLAAWLVSRRVARFDWRLGAGAALLIVAVLAVPTTSMGSWAADERIVPVAAMALLLALPLSGKRKATLAILAVASVIFFVRLGALTASWVSLDRAYSSHLAALEKVPRGARMFALVFQERCQGGWGWRRTAFNQLPSMAIVRKHAFINSYWRSPASPLVRVIYDLPPSLRTLPSQKVPGASCPDRLSIAKRRIDSLPNDRLDYVWLIDTRGEIGLRLGLRNPLHADRHGALYRLD